MTWADALRWVERGHATVLAEDAKYLRVRTRIGAVITVWRGER